MLSTRNFVFGRDWTTLSIPENNMICKLKPKRSEVLRGCIITSIFCYSRIHIKLRHQQVQVKNNVSHGQQNGEGNSLNITRYKKTVSSIMWVQLALVACYVPWIIVTVLFGNIQEHFVAWMFASTLVYLNSSLNPILYCWKIKEVKQAVKGTIRQLLAFSGKVQLTVSTEIAAPLISCNVQNFWYIKNDKIQNHRRRWATITRILKEQLCFKSHLSIVINHQWHKRR